jgi:2-dehydropantoate 2-reductase
VFVKSTITDIGVKQNKDVIGENTIVLTLQNGLGNIEKINKLVNLNQIIAGTSANGASMIEPGKINHAGNAYQYSHTAAMQLAPKQQFEKL